MSLKKKNIKEVKSILKKHRKEFVESVMEGNEEKAKKSLEWISLSSQIISDHKKRNSIILAIVIGATCLIITAIISFVHIKTTNVSIFMKSETAKITLANDWQNGNIAGLQHVWIDNVFNVSGSLKPEIYSSEIPIAIEFWGDNIEVTSLHFNKQTEIDLQVTNNILLLFTNDSLVTGKIVLRKGIIQLNDFTDTLNVPVNRPKQFYTFTSKKTSNIELIRMDFSPADKFTMINIKPAKLHFIKEDPAGSANFESTFISGKIILYDIKKEIELLNGENIQIEFTKCRDARFFVEEEKAVIQFTGKVKILKGGLIDETKNYKPTLLEYFYQNQRSGLLWSAFVFLMGILYSIKNIFIK